MPALRLGVSIAFLIAAGFLLLVAGFGIYFAISTASDGIGGGGGGERERFISTLIEASALPSGVAFLIAGAAAWQRDARAFRPILSGIGLLLFPIIAAALFGPVQRGFPTGDLLTYALLPAMVGLAATFWLQSHGNDPSTSVAPRDAPAVLPGRKRRIAAFVIALVTTVPLVPLIFLFAALSFSPLEASGEPNVWGGIAVITFGVGMVAMVIVAAFAMVRPQRSMPSFVAIAMWFALSWLILFVGGSGDASDPAGWLVAGGTIALPLLLGWLSQVSDD